MLSSTVLTSLLSLFISKRPFESSFYSLSGIMFNISFSSCVSDLNTAELRFGMIGPINLYYNGVILDNGEGSSFYFVELLIFLSFNSCEFYEELSP